MKTPEPVMLTQEEFECVDRYVRGAPDANPAAARAILTRAPGLAALVAAAQTAGPPAAPPADLVAGIDAAIQRADRRAEDAAYGASANPSLPTSARVTPRTASARARQGSPMTRRFLLSAGALAAATVVVALAGRVRTGASDAGTNAAITGASRSYTTTTGQRAAVTLPDGSRVTLAPETELRFHTLSTGARLIELNGQAAFTVTHDPSRPFTVRTGAIETRVLGTTFDVRRYASDSLAQVAVSDGKVAVSAGTAHGAVVLTAGHAAVASDSAATAIAGDVAAMTAWTEGKLVFTNTPVPQVLRALERWTGYTFRLGDASLARQHVTGALTVSTPGEAVRVLRDLLDVTTTIDARTITLHARDANSREAGTPDRTNRTPAPRRGATHQDFPTPTEVGK